MKENMTIKLTDKSFYREQYYNGGQIWYKGFFVGRKRHGLFQYNTLRTKTINKSYYAV
jgi:hypothetical protein